MASFHFNNKVSHKSLFSNIGTKIKNVAEIAGALKGIYDIGKLLYNGAWTIGPVASTVGLLL